MKSFANSDSFGVLTLPAHNIALSGDTLTTIGLNHEWRELIAAALIFYFTDYVSDLGLDNENFLDAFLEDLYTFEAFSGMTETSGQILLSNNKTTLSTTFVDVPEATFSFIFRKRNVAISWHNVHLTNAGALTETLIQPTIVGLTPDNKYEGRSLGNVSKVLSTKAVFLGIDTEATYTIRLQFRVIGGNTGTIFANSQLGWQIDEWDDS